MTHRYIHSIALGTLTLIVALMSAWGLQSCAQRGAEGNEKPSLCVTIEPMRYFAESIAGDVWLVASLVPKGMSPESYDPTPEQIVKLSKSTAFMHAGGYLGFEDVWLERLQQNAKTTKFVDTSAGIAFIEDTEEHAHAHGHHHAIDPHIWCSANNARIMAQNMLNTLVQLDADKHNQQLYQAGYERLMKRIDTTDSLIKAKLQGEQAQRAFVIYHPALTYFAQEYGLQQICIEQDGKEPTPAQLGQILKQCAEQGVKTIFIQPEFDVRNAEIIARQNGKGSMKVVQINPLDYDWNGGMLQVADELSRK